MDLVAWQIEAGKQMENLLLSLADVERTEYKGSLLDLSKIDKYSDVDMNVYILNNYKIDFVNHIHSIFKQIGDVFAYQAIESEKQDTIRLCFDNGNRFDLSIIYPSPQKHCREQDYATILDRTVNEFWFTAIMAVVKIGRKDNLIAAHLALELYQLTIVVQMLARDFNKNTNIHRYGDSENVPSVDALNVYMDSLKIENPISIADKILGMIFSATSVMDKIMLTLSEDYNPRDNIFNEIYRKRLCCKK